MTRVFIHEFVTGGGCLAGPAPRRSLLAEGAAMRAALAADLAALPDVEVATTHDERLPGDPTLPPECLSVQVGSPAEERRAFQQLSGSCDWTVLIAPEFDDHLRSRCELAVAAGGRLLSPGAEFVALTADKQGAAETLAAAGVPVPHGIVLQAHQPLPPDFPYPAVIKPRFGAGSQDMCLVTAPDDVFPAVEARLEAYRPGTPASIAVLCGIAEYAVLPPTAQRLSDDGQFRYLGGSLPLAEPLRARAVALAQRTLAALPPALGYIGIDVVLGVVPDGTSDVVIEVNPRLTTSYVGLRAAAETNIAGAMLQLAGGGSCAPVFGGQPIEFDADGNVHHGPSRARKTAP